MTIFPRVRASASRAEFVNRPRTIAGIALATLLALLIASHRLHADHSESLALARLPPALGSDGDYFRLSLAVRGERMPYVSLQSRSRRLLLREFVEPEPPSAESVSLGVTESREGWDWAGLRRQMVRGLSGARRIRFDRESLSLCVESERFNEPGRMPGVVQDAAIAAGVRARLAGEPELRLIVTDVQCREGCVRLRGRFEHCPEAARAVTVALAVQGVREVRTDLPEDLRREMAANR